MTTLDLFTEIGATEKNISEIQSKFFTVIKVPMITFKPIVSEAMAIAEAEAVALEHCKGIEFENDADGLAEALEYDRVYRNVYTAIMDAQIESILFQKPADMYGVYNAKNGKLLSQKSMGKDFLPMQQQEFLDNILATIHEFGADLDLDTLSFKVWDGGAKIEFSVKMYPISFKNDKGLQDITNMIMTFSTSYDGSKSNRIAIFTERLVCLNGMTALKLSGELKGRNTQGGKTKILSYAKEVAEIFNSAEDFRNKMMALDKIKVTTKQVEAFKKSLLGYNRASLLASDKKSITRNMNILESLETAIELEFKRTGKTAFGLLQGATYYTNHLANSSKKISDAEYIRFHQGAKTNDKAQELVFALLEY